MVHVASVALCRELYGLSGYEPDEYNAGGVENDAFVHYGSFGTVPAYDLGYLIRHLPLEVSIHRRGTHCEAVWHRANGFDEVRAQADTPEDAAAALAIQLIRQGAIHGR